MNTLCERLKQERLRLGLNQDEFAEIGGVAKGTYFNYEAGKREPMSGFLIAIAAKGADTQYILTGKRSFNPPSDLSPFDQMQCLISSMSKVVEDLDLENECQAADLRDILCYVAQGKAEGVKEAMQDYAGSNLTVAEKDLLAAYRKAAQQDQAFMERLAALVSAKEQK